MYFYGILAAFAGGFFGASIGALPAFILSGLFAILGSIAAMVGASDASSLLLNYFAFGGFLGPHIAFLGGAVASGYAHKKGHTNHGADITIANAGYNDPSVLLVGGLTGVIAYLFKEFLYGNLFAGSISSRLVTDGPALTIFTISLIARLLLGGPLRTGHRVISEKNVFINTVLIGIFYSLLTSGVYVFAISSGINITAFGGVYTLLAFGIAATGLIFAQTGQAYYGCHHIVFVAATATVQSLASTKSLPGSLIIGVLFGTITAVIGDIELNLINTGDTNINHIDNCATGILIMIFVTNALFPIG